MSVVDEIKQRIDIVELVSEYVTLKKAGRNYKALCPFHQEKTPSFIVFPDTQTWHCFGSCGEGGDIFAFVQKHEGVEFGEAVRILARKAGVSLEPPSEEAARELQARDRLLEILEAAASFFSEQLSSSVGQVARAYLASRGVGAEIAAEFQLGYAPNAWRSLSTRLMTQSFGREELLEAGLIVEREDGRFYDRFRHRLIFPICDARGRVVGFGARTLDGSDPKYLNSPQTRVFDKRTLLYGLDKARRAIMEQGTAVIVEGYMDVIAAHEAGYRNVVASMGTAIGEAQLQSLSRYADRYVLALDADTAGSAATARGVEVAAAVLQDDAQPTLYDGLLRFERRLKAEIRVAVLPEGLDPDEIIRHDPAAWQELIAGAKGLVDYYFDVALVEEDLSDAKGKTRFARRLLPIIAAVADPVERTQYVERLAREIRIDPKVVEMELAALRNSGRPAGRLGESGRTDMAPRFGSLGLEEYVIGFVVQHGGALAAANDMLSGAGLERLQPADFSDAANRAIFAAIVEHGAEDRLVLRTALDGSLRRVLDHIGDLWARSPDTREGDLWQDGLRQVLRLRKKRLSDELRLLELAMESAEQPVERSRYLLAVEEKRKSLKLVDSLAEAPLQRPTLRTRGVET